MVVGGSTRPWTQHSEADSQVVCKQNHLEANVIRHGTTRGREDPLSLSGAARCHHPARAPEGMLPLRHHWRTSHSKANCSELPCQLQKPIFSFSSIVVQHPHRRHQSASWHLSKNCCPRGSKPALPVTRLCTPSESTKNFLAPLPVRTDTE